MSSNPSYFEFTSEAVSEGHPDKLCDQVSDAVLDAVLTIDPNARVACETLAKGNMIILAGEITMRGGSVDYEKVVRDTVRNIGYNDVKVGMDWETLKVQNLISTQSPDIAQSVDKKDDDDFGAGDQGIMFGYATNEVEGCEYMPCTHYLSCELASQIAKVRKANTIDYLGPDSKTQVTIRYHGETSGKITPVLARTIVVSTQTVKLVDPAVLYADVMREVIEPVFAKNGLLQNPIDGLGSETPAENQTIIYVNPSGQFMVGGPEADAGLTGRKIIVDTYGGWGAHGGGAFSGKDYTKVDRSASYYARYVAKALVKSGICQRCLIQVSYAIGIQDALSVFVEDYGTCRLADGELDEIVRKFFCFKPSKIVQELQLKRPVYSKTATCGHFGGTEDSWECVDAVVERILAYVETL